MAQMNAIQSEFEEIEALLPWHAAGTLCRRDADRVERALASDRELARRFELAREELNETILLNESLGAPSGRTMEKLFAAIDAEPVRRPKVSLDIAGRLAGFVASFQPRTLALAGSVAALAIVLQAGVIVSDFVRQPAAPQVASNTSVDGPQMASADVSDGSLAAIRFSAKAEAGDINKFLVTNKASVIDGPKAGGIYTIRLPETGKAKEDHIKQMQAHSGLVDFVATVQ
jgi:hypothetical protein